MFYYIDMNYVSNKTIAIATLGSWLLIMAISLVNTLLYGSPPADSILHPFVAAFIGWFAFIVTIVAVIKLFQAPEPNAGMM